jgi:hypothetical protein
MQSTSPNKEDVMHRSTRLIALAVLAAALLPGAHAALAAPAPADAVPCSWVVFTDDLGVPWYAPGPVCEQATPSTVNSPSAEVPRAVTAKHTTQRKPSAAKQRAFWGMITDNSPSQNRVAPRKVAATRTLASTLWTHIG